MKKVSEYCIKKGLSEIDEEEYIEVIKQIARKKAIELAKERSKLTKMAKMYRFLMQRGYEQDIVTEIIKEMDDKSIK